MARVAFEFQESRALDGAVLQGQPAFRESGPPAGQELDAQGPAAQLRRRPRSRAEPARARSSSG